MNKQSILYVDDEVINLRIFKSTFRRQYDVIVAESGKEALEIMDNRKIDLILTDQRMPEMTGLEFLKKVFSRYPVAPPNRLMISGYSDKDAIEAAFKLYKLYEFVAKPWDADELNQIMINALAT